MVSITVQDKDPRVGGDNRSIQFADETCYVAADAPAPVVKVAEWVKSHSVSGIWLEFALAQANCWLGRCNEVARVFLFLGTLCYYKLKNHSVEIVRSHFEVAAVNATNH